MNELILYTTEDGRSQIFQDGELAPAATVKESLTVSFATRCVANLLASISGATAVKCPVVDECWENWA